LKPISDIKYDWLTVYLLQYQKSVSLSENQHSCAHVLLLERKATSPVNTIHVSVFYFIL